jgi:thiamine phosphate synthase YjbQ (UPF0047 family)
MASLAIKRNRQDSFDASSIQEKIKENLNGSGVVQSTTLLFSEASIDANQVHELHNRIVNEEIDALQETWTRREKYIHDQLEFAKKWDSHQKSTLEKLHQAAVYDMEDRKKIEHHASSSTEGSFSSEWGFPPPPDLGSGSSGDRRLDFSQSRYVGRPLYGATSGAAYISAEYSMGFPPKKRNTWRYNVGDAIIESNSTSSSSIMDAAAYQQAKETLKQPNWPDRIYPPLPNGIGDDVMRSLAVATSFDDLLFDEQSQALMVTSSHTKL